MKHHPLLILTIATFILVISLMVLVGYWIFFPTVVVTVDNPNTVPVDKQTYIAGDRITYTLSYCKTRPMIGKVQRALVDGYRTVYDTVYSDLPTGCHTTKVNELTIPDFTPTGTYYIDSTVEYQPNPLRKVLVIWRTVDFKVIGKDI